MNDLQRIYGDAEAFHAQWAPLLEAAGRRLVEGLPSDARRILDLGAGTGANVPGIARVAPSARIVAADFVEPMVRRVPPPANRVVMDASRLGFSHETFDGVLMAFMLFHVPDHAAALAEVRRCLRPGGTLAVGTWAAADPGDFAANQIWTRELDAHGAAVPPPSIMQHELMDTAAKLTGLLLAAGFEDVASETQDFEDPTTPEVFLERRTKLGCSYLRFDSLDAAAQRAMLERVREQFARLTPSDFVSRERAIYAWAR